AHQHTRRERLVVAQRLPDVTEIENLARGQKRFQKERAIAVANIAISTLRMLRYQIETRWAVVSRISAVIQTKQTDDLERNAAHWLERAKSQLSGKKSPAAA